MKKKRRSPYNIENVMERDNCTREVAIETINELKSRTSGSKGSFIKRYGKELGEQQYKEFCEKSAITKEKFQSKYGDKWEQKWNEYLQTKDSMSLEFHIKKYGKDIGKQKYNERKQSVIQTLDNMIKRYGKDIGTQKYSEMIEKRSYSCTKEGLIEKFGEDKALEICKSRINRGEDNGMFGRPSPEGSGNGWSGWYKGKHFRSLLELSYMIYLSENNIDYKTAETKEYEVIYEYNNGKITYRPDFIVDEKIIEIKPSNLVNTEINKIKFIEAKNIFGKNFKVLTEKDFPQLRDITKFIENGDVKLMDRYQRRYDENYKN